MINRVQQPSMLIDLAQARRNIRKMKQKADANHLIFRPHFKTHQSATIGELFRNEGVRQITVSSVQMAQYFAQNGWTDISIAFPVNLNEAGAINDLAEKISLNILLDSEFVAEQLHHQIRFSCGVFIKIDTGYGRAGILWDDFEAVKSLINKVKSLGRFSLKGLLVHDGNTYHAHSQEEILQIRALSQKRIRTLKEKVGLQNELLVSVGDTPSCSIIDTFEGVDEIRPGNFVFYDLMQLNAGVCSEFDIAAFMQCPIVGVYKEKNQIIVYGGGIHFSKDFLMWGAEKVFGALIQPGTDVSQRKIMKSCFLRSLSQEHGIVQANQQLIESVQIGDPLLFVPVHSCLTASIASNYFDFQGNRIEKYWSTN